VAVKLCVHVCMHACVSVCVCLLAVHNIECIRRKLQNVRLVSVIVWWHTQHTYIRMHMFKCIVDVCMHEQRLKVQSAAPQKCRMVLSSESYCLRLKKFWKVCLCFAFNIIKLRTYHMQNGWHVSKLFASDWSTEFFYFCHFPLLERVVDYVVTVKY